MAKQFSNYEKAKERARYTGSTQLPAGGYVAKIMGVKYVEAETPDKSDYIVIQYDISEGEYIDFFRKQYNDNPSEDKKWKGRAFISYPRDDGSENDEKTQTRFMKWVNALEDSNSGYSWDWDESKWKDKVIGLIYGEVGKNIGGKNVKYTTCKYPTSVSDIREGKFNIPDFYAFPGYSDNYVSTDKDGMISVPAGVDEEIPF